MDDEVFALFYNSMIKLGTCQYEGMSLQQQEKAEQLRCRLDFLYGYLEEDNRRSQCVCASSIRDQLIREPWLKQLLEQKLIDLIEHLFWRWYPGHPQQNGHECPAEGTTDV